MLYCKPADDLLPSPEATLITGITPQHAQREGVSEAELIGHVLEEFSVPHTCVAGYNSLRFDDEFIRYTAYRNFHDPYEREWRNGNSRWDLLDMLRLAQALRPDGIVWPKRDDGGTSFKLTALSAANDIGHEHAHDALSDVHALIALARRFRQAQPRYVRGLPPPEAGYRAARREPTRRHSRWHRCCTFPAGIPAVAPQRRDGCADLSAPAHRQPRFLIVFDLDADPEAMLVAGCRRDRRQAVHAGCRPARRRVADSAEGGSPQPLPCPRGFRQPARPPDFERLKIDPQLIQRRAETLRRAEGLAAKLRQVFARPREQQAVDADAALYDGFVPDRDKRRFPAGLRLRAAGTFPQFATQFEDPRLVELVFRYQARNWPESLDARAAGSTGTNTAAPGWRATSAFPRTRSRLTPPASLDYVQRIRRTVASRACSMRWKTGVESTCARPCR